MFQEEANNYSTSQLTRKHAPQEEEDMSDLESFAFWLLAENFKRSATVEALSAIVWIAFLAKKQTYRQAPLRHLTE